MLIKKLYINILYTQYILSYFKLNSQQLILDRNNASCTAFPSLKNSGFELISILQHIFLYFNIDVNVSYAHNFIVYLI